MGVVLMLLGFAAVFRVVGLGAESFWLDEAVTARITGGSFLHVFTYTARDSTPPLYFAGLWLWRLFFPGSDFGMRLYSVAWSLTGLIALYVLARETAGRSTALIALALGAIHPLDVYFAQEARMYAATGALLTAGAAVVWSWQKRRFSDQAAAHLLALYAVVALLALVSHYVAIAVLLAHRYRTSPP